MQRVGFQAMASEHSRSLRIPSLARLGTLPGIHPLHDDLILLALHHVVGEHGVEVRDGSRQHDPVSAEFMVPYLKGEERGRRADQPHPPPATWSRRFPAAQLRQPTGNRGLESDNSHLQTGQKPLSCIQTFESSFPAS